MCGNINNLIRLNDFEVPETKIDQKICDLQHIVNQLYSNVSNCCSFDDFEARFA